MVYVFLTNPFSKPSHPIPSHPILSHSTFTPPQQCIDLKTKVLTYRTPLNRPHKTIYNRQSNLQFAQVGDIVYILSAVYGPYQLDHRLAMVKNQLWSMKLPTLKMKQINDGPQGVLPKLPPCLIMPDRCGRPPKEVPYAYNNSPRILLRQYNLVASYDGHDLYALSLERLFADHLPMIIRMIRCYLGPEIPSLASMALHQMLVRKPIQGVVEQQTTVVDNQNNSRNSLVIRHRFNRQQRTMPYLRNFVANSQLKAVAGRYLPQEEYWPPRAEGEPEPEEQADEPRQPWEEEVVEDNEEDDDDDVEVPRARPRLRQYGDFPDVMLRPGPQQQPQLVEVFRQRREEVFEEVPEDVPEEESEGRSEEEYEGRSDEESGGRSEEESERSSDEESEEESERRSEEESEGRSEEESEGRSEEESEESSDDESEGRSNEESVRMSDEESVRRSDEEFERRSDEEFERRSDEEFERRSDEEFERRSEEASEERSEEESEEEERERQQPREGSPGLREALMALASDIEEGRQGNRALQWRREEEEEEEEERRRQQRRRQRRRQRNRSPSVDSSDDSIGGWNRSTEESSDTDERNYTRNQRTRANRSNRASRTNRAVRAPRTSSARQAAPTASSTMALRRSSRQRRTIVG